MILYMILVSSHLHRQIPYDRDVDEMSYCTFASTTVYFLHNHGKFVLASVTKPILKFIYSEKATKFCEISTVYLTVTT